MTTFNYDIHFKHPHRLVNYVGKKDYRDAINLSSNQLEHSKFKELFQNFITNFSVKLISEYVYHADAYLAISQHYHIARDEILLTAGSDIAVLMVLDYLCSSTKNIILQMPNYMPYFDYSMLNNTTIQQENFLGISVQQHVDNMLTRINNSKPGTVIITNPNNYLGTRLPLAAMHRIAEASFLNNHLLIIDEAYCAFNDFDHLDLARQFPNIIIIRTYSKSHGMAGLRLGCVIGNSAIITYLKKSGIEKSVSVISMKYFQYLIENTAAIEEIKADILYQRQLFETILRNEFPRWHLFESNTNFVTLDLGSSTRAKDLAAYLEEKNIFIKVLSYNTTPSTLIRITVSEDYIMEKVTHTMREFYQACETQSLMANAI